MSGVSNLSARVPLGKIQRLGSKRSSDRQPLQSFHLSNLSTPLDPSRPKRERSGREVPQVLVPFSRSEGCSVEEAAENAGKSVRTMRLWCEQHHIGRRVGGGPWVVSRVALEMLLDGNNDALDAYLSGDRFCAPVVKYYERIGLADLIQRWHSNGAAISAMTT
jgi:hypothetical protein